MLSILLAEFQWQSEINIDSKNPYDYIPPSTVFEQRNIGRLKILSNDFSLKSTTIQQVAPILVILDSSVGRAGGC